MLLVDDNFFEALVAILTDVFVDWHEAYSLVKTSNYSIRRAKPGNAGRGPSFQGITKIAGRGATPHEQGRGRAFFVPQGFFYGATNMPK